MRLHSQQFQKVFAWLGFVSFFVFNLACVRTTPSNTSSFWSISGESASTEIAVVVQPTALPWNLPAQRDPNEPLLTPTPDAPHPLPTIRIDPDQYQVQPGDTLGLIANRFGVSMELSLIHISEPTRPY